MQAMRYYTIWGQPPRKTHTLAAVLHALKGDHHPLATAVCKSSRAHPAIIKLWVTLSTLFGDSHQQSNQHGRLTATLLLTGKN